MRIYDNLRDGLCLFLRAVGSSVSNFPCVPIFCPTFTSVSPLVYLFLPLNETASFGGGGKVLKFQKCPSARWDKSLIKYFSPESRTLLWRVLWAYFIIVTLFLTLLKPEKNKNQNQKLSKIFTMSS